MNNIGNITINESIRAILFFFSSIIFLISYMIFRKIHYNKKTLFIYLSFSLIITVTLFKISGGLAIFVLLFILAKADLSINKINKGVVVLTAILVLMNYFICDALVNLFLKAFINISLNIALFVSYIILSDLLTIISSFILSKLISIDYIDNTLSLKKLGFNKQIFLLLTINFSLFAISITFITYNILNINDIRIYAVNFVLFISFLICNIIMSYFHNQYSIKQSELINNKMYMERLYEYTSNIENLYDNLRTFKHDYKNILLTLNYYIENKDIDSLEKYYKENILDTGLLVDTKDHKVKLKNLKSIPIKSLVLANIAKAESKNINIDIEILEPIIHFNIKDVDLSRLLGIYIDNAIEECELTEEKKLSIAFILRGVSTVIVIQNSCRDNIPLFKINEKGFSTKGENRGLGLYNAKKIVDKYENCLVNTNIENNVFTLELWIRN
ncbi:GHKL domain-containing protein [Clostridium sp.]|uniref:sensor histidine kinase n=1 Tax=Clostridium sp. TaxID=1506 RepID=UPI001B692159|nr:GHKL domain-containing protein [Clostridium sp.]MBP3915355.1 GHKL domain-containing protein [Clostridium sp.]MEE0931705.1 GHKL domain-containing protein [Clostridium sp.]